ncbi:hypothetical protein [Campylobacter coli]|uniref:hypothetical protein n=1 Tax=Campylobacter coli TaxID=195 RepID=UPI001E3D77C1|nr:hypothetical protein [Campylobacter coli]
MFNLREHCFTDNELGDNFVGIRSKNNNLQKGFVDEDGKSQFDIFIDDIKDMLYV